MVYRRQGQITTANSGSRGGSGLPPLGVSEQAPPAAAVTSGVRTEGTATKHHPLLLSLS